MSIANSNVIAKVAAVVAGLGLVFSSFAYAVPAKAATTAELEAQVAALLAQIQALQGGSSSASAGAAFTMDMTIGASGAEVTRLQNWLISKGYSIPAGATGYFGAQTAAAVAKYQMAKGITPAAGYFGPMTRAAVNAEGGSSTGGSTGGNTGSDSDLEGGAGSVDDYSLISALNNEEVGEDEEEVEVAGLEIEADDGSDLEFTAVRLFIEEGATSNSDFEDYASEISVMLDGETVATIDADELGDDDDSDSDTNKDWTKTISLESGAIIRAGETGELTLAITGASNLDSNDAGDSWTVDFTQVRFVDANGASISEDPATAARTFTFQTFATATDLELKASLTDGDDADEINDGHVVDIDDSDDTDGVEVLAFNLEVEGDSEVLVDSIPVLFTSVEATGNDPDDLVASASLWFDGEEIATENFLTTDADDSAETITFDDLEMTLEGGEEYEFVVSVDVLSTGDVLDAGDTLQAAVTVASIDADDESGETLASGDLTGSASADAVGFYDKGIMVEFVSADAEVTYTGDVANTNDHDRGTFEIVFDVTAFDTDVYVDSTAIAGEGDGATYQNIGVTGSPTITGSIDSSATAGTNGFLVEEDETERFTVTAQVTPAADGFFSVNLASVLYALTDIDGNLVYSFDMADYKTPQIYLNYDA